MALSLPWTFSKDDPAGPELEDRLQEVLDTVSLQFPVGNANLAERRTSGTATVTWPGGAVLSNVMVVTHNLGTQPVKVIVSGGGTTGLTLYPSMAAFTFTATQFSVQASTVDGQLPLNTATAAVYWIAIA